MHLAAFPIIKCPHQATKKVFINSNVADRRDGSVWLRRKQAELLQRK
jgi:hypothetical protein